MEQREISVEEVTAVLDEPERSAAGATAVEYDGVVAGRALHVVVVRGPDQPLVITVYEPDR